jgi:flavin reductase (DIM6/NTAB) family NADH-FMN oxidoreductase RutF
VVNALGRVRHRARTLGPVDVVGAAEYRSAMGNLAVGVCLVTSDLDGEDVGMTATALCSLSLDPPTLLLSVGDGSRMAQALEGCDTWAVSLLPAGADGTAARFASRNRPSDRLLLTDLAWHRGPATGHVLLDEALAAVECRTYQRIPVVDHTLVLAHAVAVYAPNPQAGPLVHFRGRYRTLR